MLIKISNGNLWNIDKEGPHKALILRYANCSLRCHICYAQRYAYLNPTDKDVKPFSVDACLQNLQSFSEEIGWIRIMGGEPLIDDDRSMQTARIAVEALHHLSNHGIGPMPKVVIQTNGLWLAKTSPIQIRRFIRALKYGLNALNSGRIVIEVSFKGPNIGDANLYALSKRSNFTSTVFTHQLQGFKNLFKEIVNEVWRDGVYSLALYPIAGLGSMINCPGFIPLSAIISEKDEEYPVFHRKTWDERFLDLVKSFRTNMREWNEIYGFYMAKHGEKLPLEGMSPSKFQFGWISQIERRAELELFARINLKADWHNPSLNLFKIKYPFLQKMLEQTTDELLTKISELNIDFYNSEPAVHYPYL